MPPQLAAVVVPFVKTAAYTPPSLWHCACAELLLAFKITFLLPYCKLAEKIKSTMCQISCLPRNTWWNVLRRQNRGLPIICTTNFELRKTSVVPTRFVPHRSFGAPSLAFSLSSGTAYEPSGVPKC